MRNDDINNSVEHFRDGWDEIDQADLDDELLTEEELRQLNSDAGVIKDFVNSINLNREMFSTGQLAKKLGVTTQAVINWVETGKIKAVKLPGGHYQIPASQFKTTTEQDAERETIFEQLWAKRKGLPSIDDDDLGDL